MREWKTFVYLLVVLYCHMAEYNHTRICPTFQVSLPEAQGPWSREAFVIASFVPALGHSLIENTISRKQQHFAKVVRIVEKSNRTLSHGTRLVGCRS